MTRDFVVGLVFLGALVTLILITLLVKGIPRGAGEYLYTVQFQNISGLVKGDQVRVRGHKIGEVKDDMILASDYESVSVVLHLYENLPPRKDYRFTVRALSPPWGGLT